MGDGGTGGSTTALVGVMGTSSMAYSAAADISPIFASVTQTYRAMTLWG